MVDLIDRFLAEFEQGRMTRREAMGRLTGLLLAVAAGSRASMAAGDESTFTAVGLNHIALRVADVGRSRAFYERHLGLRWLSGGERSAFLSCGSEHFVALFHAERPGLDHYCYTVPDYDPGGVVMRLESAGLRPRRREDRVYFDDPDGLTVQVSGPRDSHPG